MRGGGLLDPGEVEACEERLGDDGRDGEGIWVGPRCHCEG